ncbi:MAG TPA: cupin domain-containing protein [Anaerolineales bacterium]|nr:cupin domain-containing protein [Anaerolineales bacterium]
MFKKSNPEGFHEITKGVFIKSLIHGKITHMTRVNFIKGAQIPNHDHPHEQTGILLSGRINLVINGINNEASPGDHWSIPGSTLHSANAIEDSELIEVFSPIREDYLKL